MALKSSWQGESEQLGRRLSGGAACHRARCQSQLAESNELQHMQSRDGAQLWRSLELLPATSALGEV